MNNEEKILELVEKISAKVDDMDKRLGKMEEDITGIKETLEEHGEALDALIEWTDNVQEVVRVPFAKPKAVK